MPTVGIHLTMLLTKHKTPSADQVRGIFGCVPAEILHVTGNGIMKYQIEIVKQIIESGSNKTKKLYQLDVLHQN